MIQQKTLDTAMITRDNYWQKLLTTSHISISEAIKLLNETGKKILLVVDESNSLKGTLTDGDIRRALIQGLDLNSSILSIINLNPIFAKQDNSDETHLKLMTINKIECLPLINENRKVVGVKFWHELNSIQNLPNKLVIMAGGKGTRLLPLTRDVPKPLLHVDGKPILERIINHAKKDGFFDFIISINYLGHLIQNYFGDGKKLGVNIEYLIEDTPLGTAGSLSLIEPLPDSPLIVTNGDILTDFSYRDLINFHQKNNAEITVATKKVAWQNPFGVLKTQGINITEYQEKPVNISQVILGVYAIEPKVLKSLKKFESIDMPSFIMRVKEDSMRTIIFPVHEEWADLGTPAQLNSANQSFQNIQEHR